MRFSHARRLTSMSALLLFAAVVSVALLVPAVALAQTIDLAPSVSYTRSIAIDAVTNRIYVGTGVVDGDAGITEALTSINGTTNVAINWALPSPASRVMVNSVTNRVFVWLSVTGQFVTIDGVTGDQSFSPPTTWNVLDIELDESTNRIYVASSSDGMDGTIHVVDGSTGAVTSIFVGGYPCDIAIDHAANKVYVVNNSGSGMVDIIDGATNSVTTVTVGAEPLNAAVNESTHKVYVTHAVGGHDEPVDGGWEWVSDAYFQLSVIDGATHSVSHMQLAGTPGSMGPAGGLAIDPVGNRIYVANSGGSNVWVVDGVTHAVSSVVVPAGPQGLEYCESVRQVCVLCATGVTDDGIPGTPGSAAVIDCASGGVRSTRLSGYPSEFAVNPASKKVYIRNNGSTLVDVIGLGAGVSRSAATVYVGSSTTLKYVGGSGTTTWRTSNKYIATVSSTGVVRGLKAGTATITATRNGVKSTCVVSVVKRAYQLTLKRGVSSGKGYLYATVKTASGSAVKYKTVKFYRSGSYVGSAKTNSSGKAALKVTKYYSNKTYKILVAGTSTYRTTSLSNSLSWTYQVYEYEGYDSWDDSAYLPKGNYRVYLYGDDNVYGTFGNNDEIEIDGYDGVYEGFVVNVAGDFATYAASTADGGYVRMVIWRRL